MGQHKLRKPFIWQDEMMEVRELFRRVDCVRRSGFSGFSTWESGPPSANTLSRNRLRRRRAQCAVELTHLNYKEAPFEALTHLHNIRGMCSRIQRQDTSTERKKKEWDLQSRPPLLRRPLTSASKKSGRSFTSSENGRPYSAPVLDLLGPPPLHYAPPKLTVLCDITHKTRRASRSSMHKAPILPTGTPCQQYGYATPTSGCGSARSQSRLCKDENYQWSGVRSDLRNLEACTVHTGSLPEEMRKKPTWCAASEVRCVAAAHDFCATAEAAKLEKEWDQIKKLSPSDLEPAKPWSTSTSDDVSASDSESLSASRSLGSDSSRGTVGKAAGCHAQLNKTKAKHNLVQTGVESRLSKTTAEKRSFNIPAYKQNVPERALVPIVDRALTSSPSKISPKVKLSKLLSPQGSRPCTPFGTFRIKKAESDNLGTLRFTRPQTILYDSENYLKLEDNKSNESPWSPDLMSLPPRKIPIKVDSEDIAQNGTNVLIKHSADPYMDFRSSMLNMIQEECLQDRKAELEELFQYYLDLNPAVHHAVLGHVISDIRDDLLKGRI